MCVRSGTSENRKNTEFATILEMGLREAYPGRDPAVLAHGALKDTHTEHPAALGPQRRWPFRRTGWWRGTQGPSSSATPRLYCRTEYPLNLGTNLVPPRVPPGYPLNLGTLPYILVQTYFFTEGCSFLRVFRYNFSENAPQDLKMV